MDIIKTTLCDERNFKKGRTTQIRYIVIHYVGANGGAKDNAVYYSREQVPASAHYFVGHASEHAVVYQSVLDGDTAWHCGRSDGHYVHPECRNANSIGIEICCHKGADGNWFFDKETVDKAVELTRALMAHYGIDAAHVVRHYDVTGKICPAPFVNDPNAWKAFLSRLQSKPAPQPVPEPKPVQDPQLLAAVDKLAARGILTAPDYWKGGCYSAANVRELLLRIAAALD